MPVLQVSDQLKPARPERLALAVPTSALSLASVGGCSQSTLQGKQDWTVAQAAAAYRLLSATPLPLLLKMHLVETAELRALREESSFFPWGNISRRASCTLPREDRTPLWLCSKCPAQEIQVSRNYHSGNFLIIAVIWEAWDKAPTGSYLPVF